MAEARRAMAEARRAWRTERLRLREELLRMSRDLEEARSATAAAEARASAAGKEAAPAEARDEISRFQDARYVTSSGATWRAKLAKSEIYPKLRAKLAKSEIYPKLLKRLFAQDLKPRRQKTDLWGLLFSAKSWLGKALVLTCVTIASLLGALLGSLMRDNCAEDEAEAEDTDDDMPELAEDTDDDMPELAEDSDDDMPEDARYVTSSEATWRTNGYRNSLAFGTFVCHSQTLPGVLSDFRIGDDDTPELDTTDSEDDDEDMPFLEMPWPQPGTPPDAFWDTSTVAAAC